MIKITFEVSEDFIKENTDIKAVVDKISKNDLKDDLRNVIDLMNFMAIKNLIDKGETEFVVTTDKLDDYAKEIFNSLIGRICLLATCSETDSQD